VSIVNTSMSWKLIFLKRSKDIFNHKTSHWTSNTSFFFITFLSAYNPIKSASNSATESFWKIMELNSTRWLIMIEVPQFRLILCTRIFIRSDSQFICPEKIYRVYWIL
jgi:hypothetical protein